MELRGDNWIKMPMRDDNCDVCPSWRNMKFYSFILVAERDGA